MTCAENVKEAIKDTIVLVKTFMRPEICQRLLISIRKFYPDIKIIVLDDGFKDGNILAYGYDTEQIITPFDIGLSKGRNELVDHCKTKYCLIVEDDCIFREDTKLEKLKEILLKGYDIVIPRMWAGNLENDYCGTMTLDGDVIKIKKQKEDKGDHWKCDIGVNVLFGKTEYFKTHRWDDRLKVMEHGEYFWRNKPLVAQSKDVWIEHGQARNAEYNKFRDRNEFDALANSIMGVSGIKWI